MTFDGQDADYGIDEDCMKEIGEAMQRTIISNVYSDEIEYNKYHLDYNID